ncbi:MAG: hypothetical protein LM589_06680 [Thermosphaera sp.]|nr:hypothetical protein [Thermosphaera sp.]
MYSSMRAFASSTSCLALTLCSPIGLTNSSTSPILAQAKLEGLGYLAKSHFWMTALNATIFGTAGYLVPYIFAQNPTLLILPSASTATTIAIYRLATGVSSAVLTMLPLSAGITGWHYTKIGRIQCAIPIILGATLLTQNEYID